MEKEKMKEEALKRLERLKLHPNVVSDFKKGTLNYSENTDLGGILYWIEGEFLEKVKEFEKRTNNVVYHATHCYTTFGELFNILYVSPYEEDWEYERGDLWADEREHIIPSYALNLDEPMFSDYGDCAYIEKGGGLVRTQ